MTHLGIRLLSTFHVELDGELVTGIATNKVRGLLAYLAVEAERTHTRETLAGMFWPERPERFARGSLSQALFNLRQALGDCDTKQPFLLVSRETIQFNGSSEHRLDVAEFEAGIDAANKLLADKENISLLEETVALYQGDFLEGFSLADSPAFESWCLLQRERLHRRMSEALGQLIHFYEQRQAYDIALQYAWQQLEMDSWREEAHTAVMRLLALDGRRSEALAQYETCRRILAEELDVKPIQRTTRLYEQIREGKIGGGTDARGNMSLAPPLFLSTEPPYPSNLIHFVARARELAQLADILELAISGRGRVAFLVGEAGSGKTALMLEFSRLAQESQPDLVVATGKGSAYTGLGDPYAAFREILAQLGGDVEARWSAGSINKEQALRLWRMFPFTLRALAETAPDLLNTFLDGPSMLKRAKKFARLTEWNVLPPDQLAHLEDAIARWADGPGELSLQQSALFEQVARLFGSLADQSPLLILLDDLQWADAGSTSLLFYLGKQLTGSRLFIIGAYRPEEILPDQDGKRHPLEPVVHEFQRDFGDILLPVGKMPDRAFVEAIVDSKPNCLDDSFREILFHLTGGHPLFTIELLRGLQERGDLVQDDLGRWQVGETLDWETLPPRVEGVIAERIGRLPETQRRMLQVASIQGETFVAEVVAQVQQSNAAHVVPQLSGSLSKDHRLVRAHSLQQLGPGGPKLSHYQFHHFLFQKYLYNSMDKVEQGHLHEATGNALETLYGEAAVKIAVQLARHFTIAGSLEKALDYLFQAGNYALKLSANEEAINHFAKGLKLLNALPETPSRLRWELSLQLALGAVLQATRGYAAPEVDRAYTRARALCEQAGERQQLVLALLFQASYSLMRPDLQSAVELGEQALSVAKHSEDPLLVAIAHHTLGYLFVHAGRFTSAREHLHKMETFYDPRSHASLAYVYGHDYGVTSRAWDAWPLWYLGYPDMAQQRGQEAIDLAHTLKHPLSLTLAYSLAAVCSVNRREAETARKLGEMAMQLAKEHGFVYFQASANFGLGWALWATGHIDEGTGRLRDCLATWKALGAGMYRRSTLVYIAELYLKSGQAEQALDVLAEVAETRSWDSERYYEAELHRITGEIRWALGYPEDDIEGCFCQALHIARQQGAKSLELRATTSLCRLWQEQGKQEEARHELAKIYDWFTEGFDAADLQEAARLLNELS